MKYGVYQMSFRGLKLNEAWRMAGEPFKFIEAMLLKIIASKGSKQILPAHINEVPCSESDLSKGAQETFLTQVNFAKNLGFTEGSFSTVKEILDADMNEGFSYCALHQDKVRIIFIAYINSTVNGRPLERIAVTGSIVSLDMNNISFLDHNLYFDGLPDSVIITVDGKGLEVINRTMLSHLDANGAHSFRDFKEFKQYADDYEYETGDARIARGLFVLKELR